MKRFIKELSFFFKIFLGIFLILFFIFNGPAFAAIFSYKIFQIGKLIKEELRRPFPFSGEKPKLFVANNKEKKQKIVLPALPPEAMENNILELPQFGIKAPIIKIEKPDLKLIYKKLNQGVVLYSGSDNPGKGYSIILGHSSQYPWEPGRYKSVFSLLSELKDGDKIYVFWEQKPLVFEVKEKKIFLPWPKGAETTETIYPPGNEPILILQSCWPTGVAQKRIAVKTVLVSE